MSTALLNRLAALAATDVDTYNALAEALDQYVCNQGEHEDGEEPSRNLTIASDLLDAVHLARLVTIGVESSAEVQP